MPSSIERHLHTVHGSGDFIVFSHNCNLHSTPTTASFCLLAASRPSTPLHSSELLGSSVLAASTPVLHCSLKPSTLKGFRFQLLQSFQIPKIMDGSSGTGSNANSSAGPFTSEESASQSYRQKADIAWAHVSEGVNAQGRKTMTCIYYHKTFAGGGIFRMKQHLAGVRGSIVSCRKVPPEVRHAISVTLKDIFEKKKKKGEFGVENPFGRSVDEFDGDEVQEIPIIHTKGITINEASAPSDKGKRKATTLGPGIHNFFKGGHDNSQPTIKAILQSKEKWHNCDMAIARWFYDACIPINAVNSPFFQKAIDQIASMGHGYKAPSYYDPRVPLLREAKKDLTLLIDSFRSIWTETGCTIMGDGWKDSRQRPLINFLVYCPKGISFIKSVDASDVETNAQNLCNLFAEIVEIVGPRNVVHMVIDNASNYKAAGTLLSEKYSTICWSPCAAHCINLILKDIGQMNDVKAIVSLASTVTVFVYNHKYTLNWLRKTKGWKEIIRPGETRFATTFIALKSLHDHKDSLQALVTSGDYKKFLKIDKGKEVKQIVLDEKFWNNCLITVRIMGPLIRLLRVCDTDERPSLGYVYEGMYRAINGIKKLFKNKERFYKPYTNIINERWDRMLRKNLHAAAYYLNPAFQYDPTFSTHPEITNGLFDYIESKVDWCSLDALTYEIGMFRDRQGSFGRKSAILSSQKNRPESWWKLFGCDAQNLQKLAIRILGQTASSSGSDGDEAKPEDVNLDLFQHRSVLVDEDDWI
ncbi:uncharacterized protein LOC122048551 [Zingiber officinale]|uniref:uncharacterized protein LOC122048551 n=1 Tax=Zingiber officinale TaxID=94328 RepID=UPI001C4C49E4|nr:uncharacterized protein LOC122048551 [Zingiber officinale]